MNNLKRIFKSKSNFIFMVIFPIILIIILISFNNGEAKISIGVIDNDNTKLTEAFINQIEKENKINYIDQSEIKDFLLNLKNDYIIEIPKNFTKDIIRGQDVKIKGFFINGTNASKAPKYSMESFVNSAKTIAISSKGDEDTFYKAIDKYNEGILNVQNKNTNNTLVSKKNISFSLGFLAFNMLMLGVNITSIVLKDKQSKIYYRIFTAPVSPKKYTIQNLLSFLVVLLLQIIVIFAFIIGILKMQIPSLFETFLLFMFYSVFIVSFALFLCSNSKDLRTVSTISNITITPMAMLGGCFWPIEIMPEILQKISNFIPITWMLRAVNKLMYNNSLYNILPEISILSLFTIVFLLLACWRKEDIII
ncbi:ABC transporter permease [Clostridium rectalis]|uniref:ABC transporter permease n=1 Tax=Clostridium rectalis TaxID=2040295 RepID=UPI001FA9CC9C|nr:ABC transporter permease [Clostridium rectalis]